MQHKWIKKLIENRSIATKIPNLAINTMNIEPIDLLHAADWEIKIVSHHLEKNSKLKFWSTIIVKILELRKDMNSYIGQDNIDIEVTTEITNKNITQRITRKLKKKLNLDSLNNRPSIFDPAWRMILRKFPLKINIFNAEKKLTHNLTLMTNNEQQETLGRIKDEYISRQTKTNLDTIQPDLLAEHLTTGVHTSLTARLYRIKTKADTLKDINFSATNKWHKL